MNNMFTWNIGFLTGFESVDSQHHHLIDLINQLSDQLLTDTLGDDQKVLFQELSEYTHYHFEEELKLMMDAQLAPEYMELHKASHGRFIAQINVLFESLKNDQIHTLRALLEYLYSWLAFHILGQDHSMGRQIQLVKDSVSPQEAYEIVSAEDQSAQAAPLVNALSSLIDLIAEQSRELREVNASLESRIKERTSALEKANHALMSISQTDALTALPNRRHAMEKLQLYWDKSLQDQKALSCMMIDADYFKEVNDRYGHAAGDEVLKILALTLQHTIRTDDFVARLGGDEFLVICPSTSLDGAINLAGQLLEVVKNLNTNQNNAVYWKSSISIGVSSRDEQTRSLDDLIKLADESLYSAKSCGRTCVRSLQKK